MSGKLIHVVVLAAGEGKRMQSKRAKVLQPVGGRSMLWHGLASVVELKPDAIHVVVGHDAESVQREVERFGQHHPELTLNCVQQTERLGTGHAVQQAMPNVPDDATVLVMPGDMPLIRASSLQSLQAHFASSQAVLSVLSFFAQDPTGYGRILRDAQGQVTGIREQVDASAEELAVDEVNSGVLMVEAGQLNDCLGQLSNDNQQQEYYLTDCIGLTVQGGLAVTAEVCQDSNELLGANDPLQLATIEAHWQHRCVIALMEQGARLAMPQSLQIRGRVQVGRDVWIDRDVIFEGEVVLHDDVSIGAGSILRDCVLAAGTRIEPYCVLESTRTHGACQIGPFARLRPGTEIGPDCKVGNFVEVKNAVFEAGAKASHLSYIGDASIGAAANIGAGTITCNYDGVAKHRTEIGEQAFIGSNSSLVAPVRIGHRATIGAGSVVTKEAPDDALTLTRASQTSISDWHQRKRTDKK